MRGAAASTPCVSHTDVPIPHDGCVMDADRRIDSPARWWFVTRKYPPAVGGMERQSYELTTRLAGRQPAVIVAMRAGRLALPLFFITAGLRLLAGCVKRDVALLHLGDGVLAPLAAIARGLGVPSVVTLHGLDVVHGSSAYRLWRRLFLRGFDRYVCVSETTRRAAVAVGVPAGRTIVIGNGVEVPVRATAPGLRDMNLLLFVGRLVRRKGLAWFVRDVLPLVSARRSDVQLAILGDGPERAPILAAARDAGVADRVRWLGALRDDDKAEWLARAGICVLPNIEVEHDLEGFGIVALEAAAAGCPVIAADIQGLRDAVSDGKSGTLVRAQDNDAWVRAIEHCLADPDASARAGAAARTYVSRHCGWDAVVDDYEQLLAEVAEGRRRRWRDEP